MRTPPFETSLRSQLQVMQRPRCARERRERWSHLPELLGGDVEVLADRLTSPVIREQNPVFAALARLHLAGDTEATTILLHGSSGLLYRALPPHMRCREELVGTAWSVLALTLSDFSEADLDSYVARRRPLMGVLYGRLRPRLIRLTNHGPSAVETLDLDRPIAAEGWGSDPDEQAIEARRGGPGRRRGAFVRGDRRAVGDSGEHPGVRCARYRAAPHDGDAGVSADPRRGGSERGGGGVNVVALTGRLTNDPVRKETSAGVVVEFRLGRGRPAAAVHRHRDLGSTGGQGSCPSGQGSPGWCVGFIGVRRVA